jgi:hypothetical protein
LRRQFSKETELAGVLLEDERERRKHITAIQMSRLLYPQYDNQVYLCGYITIEKLEACMLALL